MTVLHLERPLVIPELARASAGVVATFGVSDEALFDVLTGRFAPTGLGANEKLTTSARIELNTQKSDLATWLIVASGFIIHAEGVQVLKRVQGGVVMPRGAAAWHEQNGSSGTLRGSQSVVNFR